MSLPCVLKAAAILDPDPLLAMADPASPSPSSVVNLTAHCRTNHQHHHQSDLPVVKAVSFAAAAAAAAAAAIATTTTTNPKVPVPTTTIPVSAPTRAPATTATAIATAIATTPAFHSAPVPVPGTIGTLATPRFTQAPATTPGSAAIFDQLRTAPATFFYTMGNGKEFERKRSRSPEADAPLPVASTTDEYRSDAIEPASPGSYYDDDEFVPSDYDEESIADSTSVGSSVYNHSYHNGRRYHKFRHGRYPIPNDEAEQNREDMLHAMMLEVTDGKLFYAPIGDYPQKILDLGTGTGIWAIEAGDKFPSAEVTGIDLSPIQPLWVPPNVKFLVDDVEDTWLNGDNIDFVHLRNMIPILKSPAKLLQDIYENLKPGGWVEMQDVDGAVHCDDGTLPADWPVLVFCNLMVEAFSKLGTTSHAAMFGGKYLEEAGFVNIRHHTAKLPYGTWPKDRTLRLVGNYYRIAAEEFFPAMGAIQMPLLGWSQPEMEVFFMQCRNAMRDDSVHAYGLMHFWSGQKPENAF